MSISQFISLSVDPPVNHDDFDENAGLIRTSVEHSNDKTQSLSNSPRNVQLVSHSKVNQSMSRCALCACWLFGMLCAIGLMSIIMASQSSLPPVQQIIQRFDHSNDQTANQSISQQHDDQSITAVNISDNQSVKISVNDRESLSLLVRSECNPFDDRDPRYHPTANAYLNCTSVIDDLTHKHFSVQKARYPNLLTYRPSIDCSKGRYLLLNAQPGGFFNDGTGMAMLHRNAVLQFAQSLNLSIIHLPWKSEHLEFESNEERESFWPVRDWEVSRAHYDQCSEQSNVKKHMLTIQIGVMPFERPPVDQHSMNRWPIKSSLLEPVNQFIADRDAHMSDGGGFTIYSSQTQISQGSMLYTNIIWEIRWWLKNRLIDSGSDRLIPLKLPFPPLTPVIREHRMQMAKQTQDAHVNERLPIELIDSDSDFEHCTEILPEHALKVAVHIRRGDVLAVLEQPVGEQMLRAVHAERYISHGAFISILTKAYKSLSEHAKSRWFVTVFSEGYVTDFADIFSALSGLMPNGHCRVSFVLNGRTIDTARRIVASDVIVTSRSAFSTMMSLFNSVAVKLDMNQDFQRAHGQANHLQMTVQQKREDKVNELPIAHHTGPAIELGNLLVDINDKAKLTDSQSITFSQRVDEILTLNQQKLQTNEPLFLKFTYLANRSNDWFYV